jgi:hypothetical protein
MYAALASQKNHMAVYLSGIYSSDQSRKEFEESYKRTGKRFNAGKSCVRFRKLDDLPVSLIGETIASLQMRDFINIYEKATSERKRRKK